MWKWSDERMEVYMDEELDGWRDVQYIHTVALIRV